MNAETDPQALINKESLRNPAVDLLEQGREPGAIASELGLPRTAVSAFKAHLSRGTYDLMTLAGIRAAAKDVERRVVEPDWGALLERITQLLEAIRQADGAARQSEVFQHQLWQVNPVLSESGKAADLSGAVSSAEFREWVAARCFDPLPEGVAARMAFLRDVYEGVRERLRPFVHRTPHASVFAALAAMYPEVMTAVPSPRALAVLAVFMGAPADIRGRAARHAWVRARLDAAVGPAAADARSQAQRLVLTRLLYKQVDPHGIPDEGESEDAEEVLEPLPAERRYKGLTGYRGMLKGVLAALEFIGTGVSKQELREFMSKEAPDTKHKSLDVSINALRSELGVVRIEGKRVSPTERGRTLLASGDTDVLADWLLMRVLGPDWLIARLRDDGPIESTSVASLLREVNPAWTTTTVPSNIRSWLEALGVLQREGTTVSLTSKGHSWAERITWTPEALPPVTSPDPVPEPLQPGAALPELPLIVQRVRQRGTFEPALIARLHSGLWSPERRHFAVLAGLSGSGKTLLARAYADAITGGRTGSQITVPVEPGWHDPGPLLGYVNPLRGESYLRTQFLDFLLEAAKNPSLPHIAILDEMNLSHPEQYMAPLLVAMETGQAIVLHKEGERFDGVPQAIPYPSNLVLLGTINMDETTHGLSDKVLDRAFVIEFWDVDLERYPKWGQTGVPSAQEHTTRAVLADLLAALTPVRLHFGWRVVDDVFAFLAHAAKHPDILPFEQALDDVVYAKVLPKLRGEDSPRLRQALDAAISALQSRELRRCTEKVRQLREEVSLAGSMRFWR